MLVLRAFIRELQTTIDPSALVNLRSMISGTGLKSFPGHAQILPSATAEKAMSQVFMHVVQHASVMPGPTTMLASTSFTEPPTRLHDHGGLSCKTSSLPWSNLVVLDFVNHGRGFLADPTEIKIVQILLHHLPPDGLQGIVVRIPMRAVRD